MARRRSGYLLYNHPTFRKLTFSVDIGQTAQIAV
jgi:hypothetical protein